MSGYSFNAFALSKVTSVHPVATSCYNVGDIINPSIGASCLVGLEYESGSDKYVIKSVSSISSTRIHMNYSRNNSYHSSQSYVSMSSGASCNGNIDPDTGVCESAPPFCSSPIVEELRQEAQMSCALQNGTFSEDCNPETESYIPYCDIPPPPIDKFCDSPEVAAMKSDGHASCVAQGGSYAFECSNEPESFTDSCSNIPPIPPDPPIDPPECVPAPENNWCDNPEPDKCIIGSPSWPECEPWHGDDPTSPLDPVKPPTVDPINPTPPKPVNPVNPPKPPVEGVPFNDSRVVDAIQNLNLDMNFGFSDVNNALQLQTNILSSSNELIYQGLKQDLEIYENNKLLQLKNTGDIVDAIGSIPEPVPYDDSGVIMAIEELGNKIGAGDCVPTEDNNYCENPHGLDQEYIATMFGQLNEKLDSELSAADSTILDSMSELATKPPVDESTVSPFLDWNISILTSNNQCVSMDWYGHELTCEFSDNFKSIFGFILFMMTLHTVIGILMEDITPNVSEYKHRRR